MSKQIDERVVEMRFDNEHFEKNVQTTMSTLDKLKEKLKFNSASKGLEDVGAAAKKVDMSGLGKGIETVHAKFSALQIVGVTTLTNITNSAVNAGKRMAKALTLEPVMSGFQEYETKINAVQTIMSNTSSKGTTMADVTRVLDELNTYADKTIYNFAEMTRNIGTFTAAGVGLEESASAIQGIANLAAASGSNSQQASTAMYQLSQALAAGTVKLMDWNSVVNAGMGGEKFQEALKATAREHGIAVDQMIKDAGSFRESLTDGWITAEVLNETLSKFTVEGAKEYSEAMMQSGKWTQAQADALMKEAQSMEDAATKVKTFTQLVDTLKESLQSGWAKTWELIFGDFDVAKEFFSGISDTLGNVINKASDARNNLIEGAMSSPWDRLQNEIEKTGISVEDFNEALKETAKESGIDIDALIKKHGSLAKAISKVKNPVKLVTDTLKKFTGQGQKVSKVTNTITKDVEAFNKVVKQVINGDFGNGEKRIKALTEAGYEAAKVQKLVNYVWERNGKTWKDCTLTSDELVKVIGDLSDKELKNIGYTDEQVKSLRELAAQAEKTGTPINELIQNLEKPSGRELFFSSITNMLTAISKPLGAIRDAWDETFGESITSDTLYKFLEFLNEFTESLIMSEDSVKNFKTICEGLLAIFQLLNSAISMGLLFSLKVLGAVLDMFDTNVLELGAHIAEYLIKFRDWVDENTIFIDSVNKVAEILVIMINGIRDCVDAFFELQTVKNIIEDVKNAIIDFFDKFDIGLKGFDLDSIKESIEETFKKIRKWIEGLKGDDYKEFGLNIVEGIAAGIKSGAKKAADAISSIATTLINAFCNLLGIHSPSTVFIALGSFIVLGVIAGILAMVPKAGDVMGELGGALIEGLKNFFINMGDKLAPILDYVKPILGGILGFIQNIFESLGGAHINWNDLFVAGTVVAVIILVKQLIDVLEKVVNPLDKLGNLFDRVGHSLTTFAEAAKLKAKAELIKSLAISIGIMAASLYLLSRLSWEEIAKGGVAILGLTAAILALAWASSKLDTVEFAKLGAFIIGLSIGVLALAGAMKILGSVGNVGDATHQMLVLLAGMALILAIFGKLIKDENVARRAGKVGNLFTKMAIAMLIMAAAIKLMAGIENSDIHKALGVIGGLALMFAMFTVLSEKAQFSAGTGSMILKMAIALAIIPVVIRLIAGISNEDLLRGIAVIAGIMTLFSLVMILSRFAGENAAKAGTMFLAMSVAIGILALTMKIFATMSNSEIERALLCMAGIELVFASFLIIASLARKGNNAGSMLLKMAAGMSLMALAIRLLAGIPTGDVVKGLAIIAAIEVLFGAMVAITTLAGPNAGKAGSMMLKMSAAILILVGAIALMSLLDPADVIRGTACISALILSFAALTYATSSMKDCMKTMIVMAAAIGIMAGAIIAMTFLDQDKLITATLALSSVIGMFSLLVMSTNLVKGGEKTILILIGAIATLGGVLYLLGSLPVESTIAAAAGLSLLLLSLAGSFAIISHSGKALSPTTIAALGVMIIGIGLLGTVVGLLEKFDMAPSIESASALSILLLAMSAACLILSGLGTTGPAALIGAGILVGVVAILGAAVLGIGALFEKFEGLEGTFDKGLSMLEKLGFGLGKALGAFISGAWDSILSVLPNLGSKLSEFMTNLGPFIEGANKIDANAAEGCKYLAQAIMYLTVGSFLETITSFVGGKNSLSEFATQLVPFGAAMKAYSKEVEGINAESIIASADAAKGLTEVANAIPREGGLWQLLVGDKNLTEFGRQLVPFAIGMKAYGDAVSGVNTASIIASADAAKAIVAVAESIPRDDGILQMWIGDKNLARFATELVPFGMGLRNYSIAVSGLDVESIKLSIEAAKAIADISNAIPTEGGLWSLLAGDKDLGTFADNLEPFGAAMKAYGDKVAGIDTESINTSITAANSLVKIAKTIPEDGLFDGKVSIDDFGVQIKKFGSKLVEYSEKVAGIDSSSIYSSIYITERIGELISSLSMVDMTGVDDFKIKPLGKALKDYSSEVQKINSESVTNSISSAKKILYFIKSLVGLDSSGVGTFKNAVESLSGVNVNGVVKAFSGAGSKMTSAGLDLMGSLVKGMKSGQGRLNSSATDIVNSVAKTIKAKSTVFSDAGKSLMDRFCISIEKSKTNITKSINTVLRSSVSAIKSYRDDYYNAGAYLSQGLASGMNSRLSSVRAAAAAMANAAETAVRAALKINSPSKLFIKIGEGIPEGLAKGVTMFSGYVKRSVTDLADIAVTGTKGVMTKLANLADLDIDAQPTIRPVIDLSDVTAGAKTIGNLFSDSSVGVMANVGAISAMMNRRNQNGTNDDVVSAIKNLGRDIRNNPNRTYTIGGVTYNEGSDVASAIETLVNACIVGGRA